MQVQPFFARFLESQKAQAAAPGRSLEDVKNNSQNVTLRFPSDSDTIDPVISRGFQTSSIRPIVGRSIR